MYFAAFSIMCSRRKLALFGFSANLSDAAETQLLGCCAMQLGLGGKWGSAILYSARTGSFAAFTHELDKI